MMTVKNRMRVFEGSGVLPTRPRQMSCLSKNDQPRFAPAMILRSATIFLAMVALLCGRFVVAAAPMCDWAKSQEAPSVACKSCCGKQACCEVGKQDAPQPAQPVAGASTGAELLAALAPELSALLYVFPATERKFVVADAAHRGYVADPLALICIRLI